ncbi:MAG: hypothetical protein ACREJT_03520, partial [Myxococcota bacterium]
AGDGGPRERTQHVLARRLMSLETWELASYVVTVVGLPLAIAAYLYEQRKERANEEEAVYQLLSDNYQDFLKVVLENADLKLFSTPRGLELGAEQRERMMLIFGMLISLFERAYLLLYEPSLSPIQLRRWRSWEDYMREWVRREVFRSQLGELVKGEDPEFVAYIQRLADAERVTNERRG